MDTLLKETLDDLVKMVNLKKYDNQDLEAMKEKYDCIANALSHELQVGRMFLMAKNIIEKITEAVNMKKPEALRTIPQGLTLIARLHKINNLIFVKQKKESLDQVNKQLKRYGQKLKKAKGKQEK